MNVKSREQENKKGYAFSFFYSFISSFSVRHILPLPLCFFILLFFHSSIFNSPFKAEDYSQPLLKEALSSWEHISPPFGGVGGVSLSVPASHRFASSRSFRLLPTHRGRLGNQGARSSAGKLLNFHDYIFVRFVSDVAFSDWTSTSPRLYYVIALRRLLC